MVYSKSKASEIFLLSPIFTLSKYKRLTFGAIPLSNLVGPTVFWIGTCWESRFLVALWLIFWNLWYLTCIGPVSCAATCFYLGRNILGCCIPTRPGNFGPPLSSLCGVITPTRTSSPWLPVISPQNVQVTPQATLCKRRCTDFVHQPLRRIAVPS